MRLLKFGGTSVGSSQRIIELGAILADYKKQGIDFWVVVSAMGGVTNKLLYLGKQAQNADARYQEGLNELKELHYSTTKTLLPQDSSLVTTQLDELFTQLEQLLNGIALLQEFSDRSSDAIASFGERLSATIVTAYLKEIGLNAHFLDARKVIRTDSNFTNAKLIKDTTYQLISEFAEKNSQIQVITGFIGSNEAGLTTTLGRGGSDYTVAIFGAALGAEIIEIWTDVDGVMTADPRKVKEAYSMPSLTFNEAMEMSHFGAKVIYPPTLKPAIEKDIPLVIKNAFNPTFEGTIISKNAKTKNFPVKGISSVDQVAMLTVTGSGMQGVPGIASRIFSALAQNHINVILITQASSEHSISFAIAPVDMEKAIIALTENFQFEINQGIIDPIHSQIDMSILAIIGENMKKSSGISGRLFSALGMNGINIAAIAQGSSELNISVVIQKNDLIKGLNAIHEAFFLSERKNINIFLAGTGLIGGTLLEQLKYQYNYLLNERQIKLNLIGLSNSRKMHFDSQGMNLENWKEIIHLSTQENNVEAFVQNMISLNMPNSVFVDCTSNAAMIDQYELILQNTISIVTPNKLANSGEYANYAKLKKTAKKHGCNFFYETNVGAGLPIIRTMQDLLISGDKIKQIEGVLSGTISYIFNTLSNEISFSEAIKNAKALGLTEPDPRDDLNGTDVARKILILAREAGLELEPQHVNLVPLLPKSCFDAPNVDSFFLELQKLDKDFDAMYQEAQSKGQKLRYIAKILNEKAHISLEKIDETHPFYNLDSSDNIISFTTKRYSQRPLVIKGPGAGAEVTAAGVFSEIIATANFSFQDNYSTH